LQLLLLLISWRNRKKTVTTTVAAEQNVDNFSKKSPANCSMKYLKTIFSRRKRVVGGRFICSVALLYYYPAATCKGDSWHVFRRAEATKDDKYRSPTSTSSWSWQYKKTPSFRPFSQHFFFSLRTSNVLRQTNYKAA
jgi:hypothetical protein